MQVNGHFSSPFIFNRGVKQGDALSCGLFVLAIDPLLRNIAANDSIRGLHIPTDEQNVVEIKVLAYAMWKLSFAIMLFNLLQLRQFSWLNWSITF